MTTRGPAVEQAHHPEGSGSNPAGPGVVGSAAEGHPLVGIHRGAPWGSLCSVVDLGAGFFDGALWARFDSRRLADTYRRFEHVQQVNPQVSDPISLTNAVVGKRSHSRSVAPASSR